MRGTNTLLVGPSGIGKTTLSTRCLLSALQRGEQASYYLFDEGLGTFFARSIQLGLDLRPYLDNGQLTIDHFDPAELSPGEFAQKLRDAVDQRRSRFIVIDSLNAYLQAMPGEHFLILQMHELLSYLNQQGVTTVMILGQHGLMADARTDVDLSYLSDSTVLLRFFEAGGKVRRAISVIKSRTTEQATTPPELWLGEGGVRIGAPLVGFEGVLSGMPTYRGETPLMAQAGHAPD